MTDAEIILWSRLRRGGLAAFRFRRQHPIGPYVADFACPLFKLALEVDGATHSDEREIAHDLRRTAFLERHGWTVLRVTNEDIYKRLDAVLDAIMAAVPPPPASPDLPRKRGRKNTGRKRSCVPYSPSIS